MERCPCRHTLAPHPECRPPGPADHAAARAQMRDIAALEQKKQMDADRSAHSPGLIGYGGVARIVAPMNAAERLKALQPQLEEAALEEFRRRTALRLAVRASDGSCEHLDALEILFADLKRVEDSCEHLEKLAERLTAEAKAEEDAKRSAIRDCMPSGPVGSPCLFCGVPLVAAEMATGRRCEGPRHG